MDHVFFNLVALVDAVLDHIKEELPDRPLVDLLVNEVGVIFPGYLDHRSSDLLLNHAIENGAADLVKEEQV